MLKKIKSVPKQIKNTLKSKKGFFVDTGVKILITVVLGALVLGGTYSLTNDTVMPNVKAKVESMFDYSGTGGSGAVEAQDEYSIGYYQNISSDGYAEIEIIGAKPEDLKEVVVDRVTLYGQQYSVAENENGIIVTINPSFTYQLRSGISHSIDVYLTDTSLSVTVTK